MVSEPEAWTKARDTALSAQYPELATTTPEDTLGVDEWRNNNGLPPTEFSQTAMRLAAHAARELGPVGPLGPITTFGPRGPQGPSSLDLPDFGPSEYGRTAALPPQTEPDRLGRALTSESGTAFTARMLGGAFMPSSTLAAETEAPGWLQALAGIQDLAINPYGAAFGAGGAFPVATGAAEHGLGSTLRTLGLFGAGQQATSYGLEQASQTLPDGGVKSFIDDPLARMAIETVAGGALATPMTWRQAARGLRAADAAVNPAVFPPEASQVGRVPGTDLINPEFSRSGSGSRYGFIGAQEDAGNLASIKGYLESNGVKTEGMLPYQQRAEAQRLFEQTRRAPAPAGGAMRATPQESADTVALHRGDSTAIENFSMDKTDPHALFGRGFYFTDSPRVAGSYTTKNTSAKIAYAWDATTPAQAYREAIANEARNAAALDATRRGERYSGSQSLWDSMSAEAQAPYLDAARAEIGPRAEVDIKRVGSGWQVAQKSPAATVTTLNIPQHVVDAVVDAERPMSDAAVRVLQDAAREVFGERSRLAVTADVLTNNRFDREGVFSLGSERATRTFTGSAGRRVGFGDAYTFLLQSAPPEQLDAFQTAVRRGMSDAGYTGIRYEGGVRMPAAGGRRIRHNAYVLWDEQAIQRLQRGEPLREPFIHRNAEAQRLFEQTRRAPAPAGGGGADSLSAYGYEAADRPLLEESLANLTRRGGTTLNAQEMARYHDLRRALGYEPIPTGELIGGSSSGVISLGAPWPERGGRPASKVTLANGLDVDVQSYGDAVPGGYNGGWRMIDRTSGKEVGYIDYNSSARDPGVVGISMIRVEPEYRRTGAADALMQRLRTEFPDRRIDPGMLTEDGARFWERVKGYANPSASGASGEPPQPLMREPQGETLAARIPGIPGPVRAEPAAPELGQRKGTLLRPRTLDQFGQQPSVRDIIGIANDMRRQVGSQTVSLMADVQRANDALGPTVKDAAGNVRLRDVIKPDGAPALKQAVLEYPGRYPLTPEQRQAVDRWQRAIGMARSEAEQFGVDTRTTDLDAGQNYMPRQAVENTKGQELTPRGGGTARLATMREKSRQFTDPEEAARNGVVYADPLEASSRYVGTNLTGAMNQHIGDMLKTQAETPADRVSPAMRASWQYVNERIASVRARLATAEKRAGLNVGKADELDTALAETRRAQPEGGARPLSRIPGELERQNATANDLFDNDPLNREFGVGMSKVISALEQHVPEGTERIRFLDTAIARTERRLDALAARGGRYAHVADTLRTELDALTSQKETLSPQWKAELERARTVPPGRAAVSAEAAPMLQGSDFTEADAKRINRYYSNGILPQNRVGDVLRGAIKVNQAVIPWQAIGDASATLQQMGRVWPSKPRTFARNFGRSVYDSYFPGGWEKYQEWLTTPEVRGAARAGVSIVGDGGRQNTDFASKVLQRIPGLGATGKQFEAIGNRNRVSLFHQDVDMLRRTGKPVDELAMEQVARNTNRITGVSNVRATDAESLAEFAANWMRGRLETLHAAFTNGGIEGDLARSYLKNYLYAGLGITTAVAMSQGRDLRDVLNPVTAAGKGRFRSNPNFGTVRVGGVDIDMFPGYSDLMRMVVTAADGVSGAIQEQDAGQLVKGLYQAAEAKGSPVFSKMRDLAAMALGNEVYGQDPGTVGYWARGLMPISASQVAQTVGRGASPVQIGVSGAVGFLGARANPMTPRETTQAGDFDSLTPENQVKQIGNQAWRYAQEDVPDLKQYDSYQAWREAKRKEYTGYAMQEIEDALKAGTIQSPPGAEEVLRKVEAAIDRDPLVKGYERVREWQKDEWVRTNPQLALDLYEKYHAAGGYAKRPQDSAYDLTEKQRLIAHEELAKQNAGQPRSQAPGLPALAGGEPNDDEERMLAELLL